MSFLGVSTCGGQDNSLIFFKESYLSYAPVRPSFPSLSLFLQGKEERGKEEGGSEGWARETETHDPPTKGSLALLLFLFQERKREVERILLVTKKSGNRERCRKLSLWNRSVDDISQIPYSISLFLFLISVAEAATNKERGEPPGWTRKDNFRLAHQ